MTFFKRGEGDRMRRKIALSLELRRLTGMEPVASEYGPAAVPAVWLKVIEGEPWAVGETPEAARCAAVSRALMDAGRA